MTLEALLAGLHLLAILGVVVFLSSQAALCRSEWMNPAIVRRLPRLDMIYGMAAVAVLLTGLARTWWGMKGMGWYWHQPLLHFKFGMFVVIGLMSIKPTLTYRRWLKTLDGGGGLPSDTEVRATRRLVMLQAHLLMLIPIAAVMLSRGVWTK